MGFFIRIFSKNKNQLEDDFKLTITVHAIKVEHPKRKTEQVQFKNIKEIKLIDTDSGSWAPDV